MRVIVWQTFFSVVCIGIFFQFIFPFISVGKHDKQEMQYNFEDKVFIKTKKEVCEPSADPRCDN